MLGRDRDTSGATGYTTDQFALLFARKVDEVKTSTAGRPAPPVYDSASSLLSSFRECTAAEVRRIIMSSPIKSCTLDPLPTFVVREHVDLLLPYITTMINSSLRQGRLTDAQKHALVVMALLKKTGLDASNKANFRPVSNLSFVSKVVEKVVLRQLNEHTNRLTGNIIRLRQPCYESCRMH